jgi:hypothetical protein
MPKHQNNQKTRIFVQNCKVWNGSIFLLFTKNQQKKQQATVSNWKKNYRNNDWKNCSAKHMQHKLISIHRVLKNIPSISAASLIIQVEEVDWFRVTQEKSSRGNKKNQTNNQTDLYIQYNSLSGEKVDFRPVI